MNEHGLAPQKVCAITGTGGYLGGCLVRYFKNLEWKVVELNRKGTPQAGGDEARVFQLGDSLPEGLHQITALIHSAYDFSPTSWDSISKVNVQGTIQLFESAKNAGVKQLVYISSMSAFEGCRSLYGKAKLHCETVAARLEGFSLRPGLIYDEAQPGGMVGKLRALVTRCPVIPIPGNGRQILYLSHQSDLCRLVEDYCKGALPLPQKSLNAANPTPWMFVDILNRLAFMQGKRLFCVPVPWQLPWILLKASEVLGLQLPMKSDSLISLLNQNPHPEFGSQTEKYFRIF
jgi:nucleoside-diphosphate-sugar epimerase